MYILCWCEKIRTKRISKTKKDIGDAKKLHREHFDDFVDILFTISDTYNAGRDLENLTENQLNAIAREFKQQVQKMHLVCVIFFCAETFLDFFLSRNVFWIFFCSRNVFGFFVSRNVFGTSCVWLCF